MKVNRKAPAIATEIEQALATSTASRAEKKLRYRLTYPEELEGKKRHNKRNTTINRDGFDAINPAMAYDVRESRAHSRPGDVINRQA